MFVCKKGGDMMNLIGIFVLCILSYCIGLQKGKNPDFFKQLMDKSPEKTKGKAKKSQPKAPAEKVVSFQQYKAKRK